MAPTIIYFKGYSKGKVARFQILYVTCPRTGWGAPTILRLDSCSRRGDSLPFRIVGQDDDSIKTVAHVLPKARLSPTYRPRYGEGL